MSGPYDSSQGVPPVPQTGQFVPSSQLALLKALQDMQRRKQLADLLLNSGVTVPLESQSP